MCPQKEKMKKKNQTLELKKSMSNECKGFFIW